MAVGYRSILLPWLDPIGLWAARVSVGAAGRAPGPAPAAGVSMPPLSCGEAGRSSQPRAAAFPPGAVGPWPRCPRAALADALIASPAGPARTGQRGAGGRVLAPSL